MQQPTEKRRVGDVVADMISADSIDDVWKIFSAAMVSYGFDKLLYGGTRNPLRGFIGHLEEALILHLGPQSYADVYIGEELYLHSASYEWAEKNRGFISWPEAARMSATAPSPEQMRIWQLNAEHGVIAGYVGGLSGIVAGMNGVLGLSPANGLTQIDADKIWQSDGKDIETLANTMQLRVASLPQTGLLRPLTTRQREVLEWYSLGKNMADIATIMELSPATIEKHLRCARETLNVETTAHAIRKASVLNLLTA